MSTPTSPSPVPSSSQRTERTLTAPLWLAHNRSDETAGRCVLLPFGRGRRLAVCARCLALYPMIIVALAAQITLGWGPVGSADWWITFVGATPGLLHWGLGRLDRKQPVGWRSMAVRVVTGGLLGLALGRALLLYYMDPLNEIFWTLALVLFFGALTFEIVARLELS